MSRSFLFSFAFFCLLLGGTADSKAGDATAVAADQATLDALESAQQSDTLNSNQLIKALGDNADKLTDAIKATAVQPTADQKVEATLTPDMDMRGALAGRLGAAVGTETFVNDIMLTRTKQLNGVHLGDGTAEDPAQQLVDPARQFGTAGNGKLRFINAQQFSIYMRFFCDPDSRSGTMGSAEFTIGDNTKIRCGDSDMTTPKSSRKKYGVNDTTIEAKEIMNLPINPARLFLETRTYPGKLFNNPTDSSNVNPLADLYFAAVMQSMDFLTGSPPAIIDKAALETGPGQAQYLQTQAENTRKSLSAYVFALLAGERMGSMGSDAAGRLSSLLERDLPNLAQVDPNIAKRLSDLRKQPSLSMAEYMNIMMYELPTSPGYLQRVNEMPVAQLSREKIRLNALQLAVNYQRNRWMEILTALEATNSR